VFFAFSSFVMRALGRLEPARGLAAMQSINVLAVTPAFMTALFGTGAACLALAVWALVDWDGSFGPYLLVGSGLHLVGVVVLTIAYHVPRNDALARLDPESPGAAGAGRATAGSGRGGTTCGRPRRSRRRRRSSSLSMWREKVR
jgi:uncharacterized membrane protein